MRTLKAVSLEILAVQGLALAAVVAAATNFRVVCRNLVTELEPLDIAAQFYNDATGLVAGNDRHGGCKDAIVDMDVCSADAARLDYFTRSVPCF
jgi:hypothetical protein